jgi:glycerophosphoryl diester phosphodiesterase
VEILAAGRGPELHNAVISSFDRRALEGVMHRAPTWPRWLNSTDLENATLTDAAALGCQGVSVEWHAVDAASVARARAAGLDVAAWTVRRRPTFDRLAALRVVAVCVEGAALDG